MSSSYDRGSWVEERNQSPEEKALRRYFRELPERPSLQRERWQLIAGAVTSFLGLVFILGSAAVLLRWVLGPVLLLGGAVTVSRNIYNILLRQYRYEETLREILPRPSDRELERWLQERFEILVRHSSSMLGVEPEKGVEPLSIVRGILWYTPGIPLEDLVWRPGGDGILRHGVYNFTVIWLTSNRLVVYACDYNFLRDARVNERHAEYYYQDVVSISAENEGSSLTLPTGESITTAQRLRIAVSNGEFFIATIGSKQLRQITGVEQPPSSDIDRMVAAVRKKLEEKKRALERAASGRAASLR